MFFKKAQSQNTSPKTAKKFDTGRKSSRHQAARRAESRRGYKQFGQIRNSQ